MTTPKPKCDSCPATARWSIANLEGADSDPIVRWFACGRHVHMALDLNHWETDTVTLYDLSEPAGAS